MSETAEERAKAVVALLKSDFGQSGEDVWLYAIRDELKVHANAALEAAWNAGASVETTDKDPQRVQDKMLAAILALRDEE